MTKKVAVYCRVSTDSSDQVNSLASQEIYFCEYIERNPQWELAQVFVDTGISGTSTRKRAAFNRMISEAAAGKFDLILTKEISRFARNTLDSIYYTRKLKGYGIGVIFMNDNINTLDADAELRLTIMSSIAQEESRRISQRVKWGQKRRMEQGVVFGRDMLGYDVRNGKLYVNEEGAVIVRLIFHKFVNEGKGTHVIAGELRDAGIRTSSYMKQWSNSVILRVIRNEKYCGDLIQKKTITPNYLDHEKKYNRGEEELVVIRDHHEPIISRTLFESAQRELKSRSPAPTVRARHSNRYCFSGKIKCAVCGSSFVSRTKKRKDGSVYKAWRCYQSASHGSRHMDAAGDEVGCDCPAVNEEDLRIIMRKLLSSLRYPKQAFIKTVENALAEVLDAGTRVDNRADTQARIDALTEKQQGLIELYLSKGISKDEFQQMKEKYDRGLDALKQKCGNREEKNAAKENQPYIFNEMDKFIQGLIMGDDWNDTFYRGILEDITVSGDNTWTIRLQNLPFQWVAVLKKI